MVYRDQVSALQAQCDSLRRRLESSEAAEAELRDLKAQLEEKLAALSRLRISEAERQVAIKELRRKSLFKGMAIAAGVVLVAVLGAVILAGGSSEEAAPSPELVVKPGVRRVPARPGQPVHRTQKGVPSLSEEELARLEADIDRLQDQHSSPEVVREIRTELESSDWRAVSRVSGKIVKTRPAAAVPILLKRAVHDSHPANAESMARVFTALTGEPIAQRPGLDSATAAKLYRGWWQEVRDSFTADACTFDEVNRRAVTRAIVERSGAGVGSALGRPRQPNQVQAAVQGIGASLCPAMVDDLLSMVNEPGLRFGAVTSLAVLRKLGDAEQLERVMSDEARPSSQRLVALLALVAAGEPFPQDHLLRLYRAESDDELRDAMIRAMANGDAEVVPTLVEAIEGPSRRAATEALRRFKSPTAVPVLRELLLSTESSNGMRDVTALLADIQTPEAAAALAANLERLSKIDNSPADWGNTLSDFHRAIGRRGSTYRGRDIEGLRQAAREAIAEWRSKP